MISYSTKWVIQRVTATLLIPLTFWFVYNCILFSKFQYVDFVIFFDSYLNSFLFLIMMISMLIHSKLGCETIIEDYFFSKKIKKLIFLLINLIIILAVVVSIISILFLIKN